MNNDIIYINDEVGYVKVSDINTNANYEDIIRVSNKIKEVSLDTKFTSVNNPFYLDINDYNGILRINKNYFDNNKDEIMKLIYSICSDCCEFININNRELIDDRVLYILSENDNLFEICLTSYNEEEKSWLSMDKKMYDLFVGKNKSVYTHGVDSELDNVYDEVISYNYYDKAILCDYNYDFIANGEHEILIDKVLSSDEFDNLKYIPSEREVIIDDYIGYDNVINIINKLISFDKNIYIYLNIHDKSEFEKTILFNDKKYENIIKVKTDGNYIDNSKLNSNNYLSILEYKRYEEVLKLFVKDALDKNYSPLEKLIYAYNITKKYKEYNENNKDFISSRDLYKILFNDYAVCVGYASLLNDLLYKLGIESFTWKLMLDEGLNIDDRLEIERHQRVYIHLKDDKYDIDGYYICDPTWDNNLEKDYYVYMALSSSEILKSKYKQVNNVKQSHKDISIIDDLFCTISINDFYNKINYLIDYLLRDKDNEYIYSKDNKENAIYKYIIDEIMSTFYKLDREKYNEIKNKYLDYENNIDYSLFVLMISDIGHYIVSKVNNDISGNKIIDASMVINNDIFNFNQEEYNEYRNYLIKINKEKYEKVFPKTKIENSLTGEVTYINEDNKFDIDRDLKL